MPRIREDELHQRARLRTNRSNQHRRRCVRHGGAGVRHAREDGRDPKSRKEVSVRFSSTVLLRENLPKENHRYGDEQTSVAGSGAR